jgi:hypothetical protein
MERVGKDLLPAIVAALRGELMTSTFLPLDDLPSAISGRLSTGL